MFVDYMGFMHDYVYHYFFLPVSSWFDLELFRIDFGGYYDTLSAIILCVVTFISLAVHLYSLEYRKNDIHLQRFLCYLTLFTFFMLIITFILFLLNILLLNISQHINGFQTIMLTLYVLVTFGTLKFLNLIVFTGESLQVLKEKTNSKYRFVNKNKMLKEDIIKYNIFCLSSAFVKYCCWGFF